MAGWLGSLDFARAKFSRAPDAASSAKKITAVAGIFGNARPRNSGSSRLRLRDVSRRRLQLVKCLTPEASTRSFMARYFSQFSLVRCFMRDDAVMNVILKKYVTY